MKGADRSYIATLKRLARLRRVQTEYTDASGVRRSASPAALAHVLTALGSPAGTEAQAHAAERALIESASRRRLEPVCVAWEGRGGAVSIVPSRASRGRIDWSIRLESGEFQEGSASIDRLKQARRGGGVSLPLPKGLPTGYHRLAVSLEGERHAATLIVAPRRSFIHERGVYDREWGFFCPTYALRSGRDLGCGDLEGLRGLAAWSQSLGGRVVATLPMLATFLGDRRGPADASPYAPVSRLFWNELFLDPRRAPEFAECSAARRVMESAEFRREVKRLRGAALVDYPAAAALKRRVFEPLAKTFFDREGERGASFKAFFEENPLARDYAAFRAAVEKHAQPWSEWPARARGGSLTAADFDADAARYHLYAQYAAWLELLAFGSETRAAGGLFYLDLPVGVSPFGFDTWRHPGLFARCSTGAPPDPYFTSGQNWGFPPMHPDMCREDGYGYLRACLRAHMRHADYLRLDHVMAFHRLYWIPESLGAGEGVYVRYRDEEMYAVLCIESHRGRCRLVGENLGTVPPEVNGALSRRSLCGLYVAQYEMQPRVPALRPVPGNCVASVNTHDMPPFATCWSGGDIGDRIGLGMLDRSKRVAEQAARRKSKSALVAQFRKRRFLKPGKADARSVRDALFQFLAESPADFLLINLEDLWLETRWQNVPGTMGEHPNWQRRLRFSLEEIMDDRSIRRVLTQIDAIRRGRGAQMPARAR